jgi:uncharacterized protein (TIGR03067 family)
MRRFVLLAIVGLSLGLAPAPLPRPDPGKADAKKMQGTWAYVSREYQGLPVKHRVTSVEIADGTWTFVNDKDDWRIPWALAFGPNKAPRQFDLTINRPIASPIRGVCRLDGDTLILCYTRDPMDRPTDFDGSKPGRYFEVLKRLKR